MTIQRANYLCHILIFILKSHFHWIDSILFTPSSKQPKKCVVEYRETLLKYNIQMIKNYCGKFCSLANVNRCYLQQFLYEMATFLSILSAINHTGKASTPNEEAKQVLEDFHNTALNKFSLSDSCKQHSKIHKRVFICK